jgi:hypothetical protein
MRACLETQKLEQLEARMDEIAGRVAREPLPVMAITFAQRMTFRSPQLGDKPVRRLSLLTWLALGPAVRCDVRVRAITPKKYFL